MFFCYFTWRNANERSHKISETHKIFVILHSVPCGNQYRLYLYCLCLSFAGLSKRFSDFMYNSGEKYVVSPESQYCVPKVIGWKPLSPFEIIKKKMKKNAPQKKRRMDKHLIWNSAKCSFFQLIFPILCSAVSSKLHHHYISSVTYFRAGHKRNLGKENMENSIQI